MLQLHCLYKVIIECAQKQYKANNEHISKGMSIFIFQVLSFCILVETIYSRISNFMYTSTWCPEIFGNRGS